MFYAGLCELAELPQFWHRLCVVYFFDLGILISEIARLNIEQLVFFTRVTSARVFSCTRNTYSRGSCVCTTSCLTRDTSLCITHMFDVPIC